jgi:hypothetical protein
MSIKSIMLNVVMPSVIMLIVVAPSLQYVHSLEWFLFSSAPGAKKEVTHGGVEIDRHGGLLQVHFGSNVSKLKFKRSELTNI